MLDNILILPEIVFVLETFTFVGDFWPSTTILTLSATVTVLSVWTTLTLSSSVGAISTRLSSYACSD